MLTIKGFYQPLAEYSYSQKISPQRQAPQLEYLSTKTGTTARISLHRDRHHSQKISPQRQAPQLKYLSTETGTTARISLHRDRHHSQNISPQRQAPQLEYLSTETGTTARISLHRDRHHSQNISPQRQAPQLKYLSTETGTTARISLHRDRHHSQNISPQRQAPQLEYLSTETGTTARISLHRDRHHNFQHRARVFLLRNHYSLPREDLNTGIVWAHQSQGLKNDRLIQVPSSKVCQMNSPKLQLQHLLMVPVNLTLDRVWDPKLNIGSQTVWCWFLHLHVLPG